MVEKNWLPESDIARNTKTLTFKENRKLLNWRTLWQNFRKRRFF